MNAFVIIAVGETRFFQQALNCCLSLKVNEENTVILIHDAQSIKGNEAYLEFFDERILAPKSIYKAQQLALWLKLKAYHLLLPLENKLLRGQYQGTQLKFIILDSDILFFPNSTPSILFNQPHSFVPYIHDVFDYETQQASKENANFWCDPMKARHHFKLENNLPQINASFIYFTKDAQPVFDYALEVWNDNKFPYMKFRGSKTEEMCFNIAMSKLGVQPRQIPYRPIYFQAFSEIIEQTYALHKYPAMGLAGDIKHNPEIVNLYNQTARYYRDYFGLKKYHEFVPQVRKARNVKHIEIPYVKRTLYRAGEVENSEGGIFNPDGIIHDGKYIEIYRKEKNFDLYKNRYSNTTAVPHIVVDGKHSELKIVGWYNKRLEDFRLFKDADTLLCNHTVCYPDKLKHKPQGQQYDRIGIGISIINKGRLVKIAEPAIPKQQIEKNWVMWMEGKEIYLLYSINPFVLYKRTWKYNELVWQKIEVKQPKFKWFNDSFICASTNPIELVDYLLFFYHTKENGIYYHGCGLMDKKTKVIKHQMKRPIKIDVRNDGIHKSILYLSGSCLIGDFVRTYWGEGDLNSFYMDFLVKDLIKAIKNGH